MEIIYGNKSGETNNVLFIRGEDLEISHGEDYKIAINELKKIQNTKILENYVPELFSYQEISLWWLIYQSLIPEYKKLVNFVEEFLKLTHKINPDKITIVDNFNNFNLIKQICIKENIKLKYSQINLTKFIYKKKIINGLQEKRYEKITNNKIKIRKQLFSKKYKNIPSVENKIIFAISGNFRRHIFDTDVNKTTRGEFIQKPIMNMLEKNSLVGIDLDYTFLGQPKILSERLCDEIPWIPIETFLQSNSNNHDQFLTNYKNILKNSDFQNLFTFNEISLWSNLEFLFKKMTFTPHLPFYLNLLDSLNFYFSKNKPKAIFLPYETGPFALAIISIFRKLGIKTIGVQHGYIYPYSPMYSQTSFSNHNSPYGFPLPDTTLVFGNYVKDLLVKNGYPPEKFEVFGNPSLFHLDVIRSKLNSKMIRKKFTLQDNQKVILFTTGKLQRNYTEGGNYDYDEQIWENLLQNYGGKNDFFIILKPHPGEKNILIYEEIMQKYPHNNVIITQNDIFELIQISSLVISVFSSTMFESLCFKKPVIRLKFSEHENHILDSSNAIITSNINDLTQNISKLIYDSKFKNLLSENALNFIKYHYNIPELNPKDILDKLF